MVLEVYEVGDPVRRQGLISVGRFSETGAFSPGREDGMYRGAVVDEVASRIAREEG